MGTQEKTRAGIAALVYIMTNAVLFGAGLVFVLSAPALQANMGLAIAIVVVASLVIAAPIAWFIAPRLRARNWARPPADPQPVHATVAARRLS